MRIISGMARGRRLQAPKGERTRPTHDRVREAVFSMLLPRLSDAAVLDLFAGSGAMGLEAVSRGAANAVFVDSDYAAVQAIRANVAAVGAGNSCRVMHSDATMALKKLSAQGEQFSIVLLDPPYEAGLLIGALEQLHQLELLAQGAAIVCEYSAGAAPTIPQGYTLLRQKRYGAAQVALLQKETSE